MKNETLELNIIGCLCIDPSLIKKVLNSGLILDDFCKEDAKTVFAGILSREDSGTNWDCTAAAEDLANIVPNPKKWVMELMKLMPTTANVVAMAEKLHEEGRQRRLEASIMSAIGSCSGEEMASKIKESCTEYLSGGKMTELKTWGNALMEVYDHLNEKSAKRIDTGYSGIDKYLKGMYPGNLVLVGARPGVGKSAFSLDLATRVASAGHKVLIFSMEMLADELAERIVSQRSGVVMDKLIDKDVSSKEVRTIAEAMNKMYSLPILICDTPNVSVPFIRARAQQTEGVELIIIDYISLMKSTGRSESRNLELGQISRDLKCLATELKIPIVALAQLNRALDDSEEPKLASLRDSGELEQNANKVLFLWNQDKENGIVGISVAKNRRGRTGAAYFRFYGELMKYVEIENYQPPVKQKSVGMKPTMR